MTTDRVYLRSFYCCVAAVLGTLAAHAFAQPEVEFVESVEPVLRDSQTIDESVVPEQASPEDHTQKVEAVEEVTPELFYLENDIGRLVPVPGFRYRDFIDLMRLKDGLPGKPQPPAAVLESITLDITLPDPLEDSQAAAKSCVAEVQFSVRQLRSGWVSLPIDLRGFVITGAPVHEGPGDMFFATSSEVSESLRPPRVWFNSTENKVQHQVSISGRVLVESSSTSDTVTVNIPPATASLLEIRTKRKQPAVTVWPVSLSASVDPVDGQDNQSSESRVRVVGGVGQIEVRVSDKRKPSQTLAAVPGVTAESLIRVDGKNAFINTTLRFENLPRTTSVLQIGLPPRTTLRSVRAPSILIEQKGSPESPVAVVQVAREPSGEVTVGLECDRTVDASGRDPFEAVGFRVEGIPDWRQRGRVSIVVLGDWQVEWEDLGLNRRIDPPPSAKIDGFVAAFAYESQPASLPLRVRPRGSRVVIEPEYQYTVGATRVALEARLRTSVRGAAVSRLMIALDGWEVEDVGPIGLVDTTSTDSDGDKLVIAFQQGLSGNSVIDFRCSRPLDQASEEVAWTFPLPEAGLLGPASVLISSETDIELIPDVSAIRGLVRQVAPVQVRSDVDRRTLAYRLDSPDGVFQAQRRFLEQRVDASIRTQVGIDKQITSVAEIIRFSVAYVPLEFIELRVPVNVMESGTLEIRQGGQLLNPLVMESPATQNVLPKVKDEAEDTDALISQTDDVPETSSSEDVAVPVESDAVLIRTMLPVPLLGDGEISASYQIPTPEVPPETTVAEDLPFVVPVDAKVGRQTMQIDVADSVAVDVRGEDWKRDAAIPGGGTSRLWTTARFQSFAPLALASRQKEMSGETIIEAAWLQTRLLSDRREDLFAYAISSAADRILIQLPYDPIAGGDDENSSAEVWLDGQRLENTFRSDGIVEVLLPTGVLRRNVLVEVRLQQPWNPAGVIGLAGLEELQLVPPAFIQGVQQRRFYWEVHVPSNQHVVAAPQRWTTQQQWVWGTFGLERQPFVSREQLALWVRSNAGQARSREQDSVDAGLVTRRAVYSGVGVPGTETLVMAATWLIVLSISGPVLVVGLLMVYVPFFRSPLIVLTASSVFMVLSSALPGLLPLLIQGALPGIFLSLMAAGMRTLLVRSDSNVFGNGLRHSSVMRGSSSPSIIVASSAMQHSATITTPGRSAS